MNVVDVIKKSWTKETCFPGSQNEWNKDNPALGQCAITALVVNDIYGGKIMRCIVGNGSHYYNLVNDKVIDLTASQFIGIEIDYNTGEERTREYLLSSDDTKNRYYQLLNNISNNKKIIDENNKKIFIKKYGIIK